VRFLDQQLTAFTATTGSYVQPAIGQSVQVPVESSNWMPTGISIFVSGGGYYTIERIIDVNRVRLVNVGGAGCVAPGTTVPTGARVIAVGQGGGTGGSGAPLTNVAFVDPAGTGTPSGAIDAPYTTIAAAVSGLGGDGTIVLAPGTYDEPAISIPAGRKLTIASLEPTSTPPTITHLISWTVDDNDELRITGIDLPNGISIKDSDTSTGGVDLRLDSLTCGAIINGNTGSAPHTHVITLTSTARAYAPTDCTTLGSVSVNGPVYSTNTILTGNVTCSGLFGNYVYLSTGITISSTGNSVLKNSEFGAIVAVALGGTGSTLFVDETTDYFTAGLALTGTGANKVVYRKAAPVTSVFGRTGAVNAVAGDYGSTKITNFSSAPGSTVDDALTYLRFGPAYPFDRTAAGSTNITTSDRRRLVRITAASTVTVPTNASQPFLAGDEVVFSAESTGAISFVGAGGVTINTPGSFTNTVQWAKYRLVYLGSDQWWLTQEAHAYHALSIVNADVNSSAAIAGTKINPNFGSQNVTTTGTVQAAQFGDATTGLVFDANSLASTHYDFRVNGASSIKFTNGNFASYCQNNYFGLGSGAASISMGNANATGTLDGLTVQARSGNGAGTYKAGTLILIGGNAATGTGTGGDALVKGGDGSAAHGNVQLCDFNADLKGMQRGVYLAEATAIPTANPSAGYFIYVDPADHKLKARGPSGTVTTIANP